MEESPSARVPASAQPLTYRTRPPGLVAELWRCGRVLVFGYDLFLSHRHADAREYAKALWPRLEELHFTVCFDAKDFHIGQRLHLKMRRTVRSSRALLLLDTPMARTSPEVRREYDTASHSKRPVLVIRQAGLPPSTWPGIDGDSPVIYAKESQRAFRIGRPTQAAIDHIVNRHTALRVRTKFLWLAAMTLLITVVLGVLVWLNDEFSRRVGLVYAARHRDGVSIGDADNAFQNLEQSFVLGRIGRAWHATELALLRRELGSVFMKQMDAATDGLAEALSEAWPAGANVKRRTFSDPNDVAILDAESAAVIRNGAVRIFSRKVPTECAALPEPAVAVAADRPGHRFAVLTAAGIYFWSTSGCTAPPTRAAPVDVEPRQLVRFAFGDGGRGLLVALSTRLLIFQCTDRQCAGPWTRQVAQTQRRALASERRDLAFCDAAISPVNSLVVAGVGSCKTTRFDLCAFSSPMRCARNVENTPFAFDARGRSLATTSPELAQWAVSELVPAQETSALAADDKGWGFRRRFEQLRNTDLAAFDDAGLYLATMSQLPGGSVLTLFHWPDAQLAQTISVAQPGRPLYLLTHERMTTGIATGKRILSFSFDLRRQNLAR